MYWYIHVLIYWRIPTHRCPVGLPCLPRLREELKKLTTQLKRSRIEFEELQASHGWLKEKNESDRLIQETRIMELEGKGTTLADEVLLYFVVVYQLALGCWCQTRKFHQRTDNTRSILYCIAGKLTLEPFICKNIFVFRTTEGRNGADRE